MDANEILKSLAQRKLSEEEETLLLAELSSAYHQDEASMSSRDVERISEKVKAKLQKKSVTAEQAHK